MRILTANFRPGSVPALGALGALLWLAQAQAAEPGPGLKPEFLSVGFSQAAFLNVNRNDAEASLKALAETVARRLGYLVTSKTQLFEETSAFEAALKNGTVNLAVKLPRQLQPVAGSPATGTNRSLPSSAPPRLQPKGDR